MYDMVTDLAGVALVCEDKPKDWSHADEIIDLYCKVSVEKGLDDTIYIGTGTNRHKESRTQWASPFQFLEHI